MVDAARAGSQTKGEDEQIKELNIIQDKVGQD